MISIIIPTHNRPEMLQRALQSIVDIGHIYPIETIIVLDGMNLADEYWKIIESFRDKGLFIRFIPTEFNSGTVCIPRNIALSYAKGDVIIPMDDDHEMIQAKLTVGVTNLLNSQCDMVFGDRIEVKNGVEKQVSSAAMLQNIMQPGIDTGQILYMKSVWDHIDPIFAINADDYYFYTKLAKAGGKIGYIGNVAVNKYHWHGKNISITTPEAKRVDPMSVLPKFIRYFDEGLFKEKVVRCLQKKS